MKNKTDKTEDAPIKKVQLNTRVPEPLKIAVTELSERTEISSETIVADALARFYGTETPGGNLRKRMYSEAIRQLEAEGKLILFPATSNRRSVHEGGIRSVLEDQTLKEISRTIAVALIVAVWLALALMAGLIGTAVIAGQWISQAVSRRPKSAPQPIQELSTRATR